MTIKKLLKLPRCYRLTRLEGFSQILKQRAQTNLWFAVHSKKNSLGHARLGISISKRVQPTSVWRNNTKRLIRECFCRCTPQDVARDVVVRLRKPLSMEDRLIARTVLGEMLKTELATK